MEAIAYFNAHLPLARGDQQQEALIALLAANAPLFKQADGIHFDGFAIERRYRRDNNGAAGAGIVFAQPRIERCFVRIRNDPGLIEDRPCRAGRKSGMGWRTGKCQ